jgi:hypothetical protein
VVRDFSNSVARSGIAMNLSRSLANLIRQIGVSKGHHNRIDHQVTGTAPARLRITPTIRKRFQDVAALIRR